MSGITDREVNTQLGTHTRVLLPWVWTGLAAATLVAWAIVDPPSQEALVESMLFIGAALLFTALGSLISVRQPGNRIAWLFWVLGIGLISVGLMSGGIEPVPPNSPTLGQYAAYALSNSSWIYMAMLYPLLLLLFLFPTGKFLGRGWMWAGWLGWLMIPATLFAGVFGRTFTIRFEETASWSIANPIGFVPGGLAELLSDLWGVGLLAMAVGGVVCLVIRYQRSSLVVRTQIKWVVYPLLLLAVSLGITLTGAMQFLPASVFTYLFVGSIALIPVSVAIAVTRYKLFEIDRIISRTVSYSLVVGLLGLVYTLGAVWLPARLIGDETPPIFVAASTLAVAALFNPIRRRIQNFVDRRFNRSAFLLESVSAEFVAKLQESNTTTQLVEVWSETVVESLEPQAIGVWIND